MRLLLNHYKEVTKHKLWVFYYILKFSILLLKRAILHDLSKYSKKEAKLFAKFTPKLKNTIYGSKEYKNYLKQLKPALNNYYSVNKHHPEYYGQPDVSISVIGSMTLVDIVEMLCDWTAATKRHKDSNVLKSIEINKNRFNYTNEMENILKYTIKELTGGKNAIS